MHSSVPRGLKRAQREQVLSGLASFYDVHITALFLKKSLRDCSTEAARHFVTVVFVFVLLLCPLLYLLVFPLLLSMVSTPNTVALITLVGLLPSGSHSPLSHALNGAPGNQRHYINEKGFTQLSTDWKHSPSIVVFKGNKMAACCEDLFKRIAVFLSCS